MFILFYDDRITFLYNMILKINKFSAPALQMFLSSLYCDNLTRAASLLYREAKSCKRLDHCSDVDFRE